MTKLTIRRPDDWHVHLREGAMLREVAPYTAGVFGRGLIMPNTTKPILTGADASMYRQEIENATRSYRHFTPVMSIKLTMDTTAAMIHDAADCGVKAVKLYPTGATTNSQDGVVFGRLDELVQAGVFRAIAEREMLLLVHGEEPSQEVLEREPYVIPFIDQIIESEPRIRVVVEHVSTERMARYVAENDPSRLAATVTAHHLYLTLDDLIGGELQTLYFCKPVVKQQADRDFLWHCVCDYPNFFFGSDSAPHPIDRKQSCSCAAGVFSGPIALPLLAQMFDEHGALNRLEEFVSLRGAYFYRLEPNDDYVVLERVQNPIQMRGWTIDGGVRFMPLRNDEGLNWRIADQ